MLDRVTTAAPSSAPSVDRAVGQKLREGRTAARLSQSELGAAIGVSFQQVQKYEKGTNRIGPARLAAAAKLLKRPVSWFYGEAANDDVAPLEEADHALARDFARLDDADKDRVRTLVARLAETGAGARS